MKNEYLIPGEDSTCWPDGAVALAARGAKMQVFDPALGRPRWFLDLICGYGAFNFGHAPGRIKQALVRELANLDGCAALPSRPAEELAKRLVRVCGFGARGKAYFSAGGSQAVEIALRIGRILRGQPKVAAVTAAFHGYGSETVQLSRDFVGIPDLDALAAAKDVVRLPWNDEAAFDVLARRGREIGVLVIEPVLGAAGFRVPDRGWFRRLLEIAKDHEIFTVLDEIQVGMGRTGKVLASEHLLGPGERRALVDAVTLSKSLAGGQWPLSAVVLNGARYPLGTLNGTACLGETFSNNPAGCAAALEALEALADGLLPRAREDGRWLLAQLAAHLRAAGLAGVTARGIGLALAIDFPDKAAAHRFVRHAWDAGLLCYVSGGRRYACVKLIPPLTLTRRELQAVDRALGIAIGAQGAR